MGTDKDQVFFVRVVVCGEGLTLSIQVYIQVIIKTWSPNN